MDVTSVSSSKGSFFLKINYFWLVWVFLAAHRLSLFAVSKSYSLLAVCGLLIAVASLEHVGSVVLAHRLSSSAACGIFQDQELNLSLLH